MPKWYLTGAATVAEAVPRQLSSVLMVVTVDSMETVRSFSSRVARRTRAVGGGAGCCKVFVGAGVGIARWATRAGIDRAMATINRAIQSILRRWNIESPVSAYNTAGGCSAFSCKRRTSL